jgi:hypothetical protein
MEDLPRLRRRVAPHSLRSLAGALLRTIRGNILATYVPSDASDAFGKPRNLDTSDAHGLIYGG